MDFILNFIMPFLVKIPFLGKYISTIDFSNAKTVQDFVNLLLAKIIDDLKQNDPWAWSIVSIIIGAVYYATNYGVQIGFITIDPNSTWAKVVSVLAFVAALFNQTRTSTIVANSKKEKV